MAFFYFSILGKLKLILYTKHYHQTTYINIQNKETNSINYVHYYIRYA
jgi:hypothetical protein